MDRNKARIIKLKKHLDGILHGQKQLTAANNSLFLEAICIQPHPVPCIDSIISSPNGLELVQSAMHFDSSTTFLNGPASTLLDYLRSPGLASFGDGQFINPILQAIVDAPDFWHIFGEAFRSGKLQVHAQRSFAWLLLRLVSFPNDQADAYLEIARDPDVIDTLLNSIDPEIRSTSGKIKCVLEARDAASGVEFFPGGRHDNDFEDFRKIAIVPTAEETMSTAPPFLRTSAALDNPETENTRTTTYLDNQFRLLRENLVYELREEMQVTLGKKKRKRRAVTVEGLELLDLYCGPDSSSRRCSWGLTFKCTKDIPRLKDVKDRKKFLLDKDNRKFLAHGSMTCLLFDEEPVAFPTINRDEDLLSRKPPVIVLQFQGEAGTIKTLYKIKTANDIRLIQIDTALFSFSPILKALQAIQTIPLAQELLFWKDDSVLQPPSHIPSSVVQPLLADPSINLQKFIEIPNPIFLDKSQADSLLSGLTQRVSLIQGPPGTGKSFIGALLTKILHDFTPHIILVVCYTNHALDQFLEDLLDIGIPRASMVRLGGKSTQRTAPLALKDQKRVGPRWGKSDWQRMDLLKMLSQQHHSALEHAFQGYRTTSIRNEDLLTHLEFDDPEYFEAFKVPGSEGGMTTVGRRGRILGPDYLLDQWMHGRGAGVFTGRPHIQRASQIWAMATDARQAQVSKWKEDLLKEKASHLYDLAEEYNNSQSEVERKYSENTIAVLQQKRIIGCTTTAAAMYVSEIQAACPNVLLVEEAGEILESHVLTALGEKIKQMILIGDHKQLRPKVNNYKLTVEKGEGYDLNRSLFERLVLKGYPHQTLTKQHRMRPEISALIRELTYPHLLDANKTKGRPDLRGVQDVIVFVDHHHPEDTIKEVADRRDLGSTTSKQNTHEAEMILKIVRYLAQQGYGTKNIVILTPYLGQLSKLRATLKNDNDPILNDLDSHDLIQAGLLNPASANVPKNPIRLATIDNYQGEESDIVLISLTRSNPSNDIGFMFSPERLNVLLSRARDALIMIGNADTFMKSRKGGELWTRLFGMLKQNGHIYDGFPIKCERHPDRTAIIRKPEGFDNECPDGGCTEPCGTILSCTHPCPSKCHQLVDHSKMKCTHVIAAKCPKGHDQTHECHQTLPTCRKCEREIKQQEDKQKEALKLQQKRDAEQLQYNERIAALEKRIMQEQQAQQEAQLAQERRRAIEQKEQDLREATNRTAQAKFAAQNSFSQRPPNSPYPPTLPGPGAARGPPTTTPANVPIATSSSQHSAVPTPAPPSTPPAADITPLSGTNKKDRFPPLPRSESQLEWQSQKDLDGARNDAIDELMQMTGLETVKSKVLALKDKIDLAMRQGTSLKDERLNVAMLGNPGTGKTTVARLFAKFLSSVGILPGTAFLETTGSRLANEGVDGIKKHIETMINGGGGAIFVDEAYQLTSETSMQGSQVLDFMLAEMENNVGKIVFILAGYNKQMEKFFEHNPGLESRVPHRLQFTDYTRSEFLRMLENMIQKKFQGRMKVEDGIQGLYARIAIERLSRGRDRDGFGNARSLQNMFNQIHERQATRIKKERKDGLKPHDFLLTKEDMIGPDPSEVLVQSDAWKKLQALIGLQSVKDSVQNLFDTIEMNYQRELREQEPVQMSLNRVFIGSPGTGKTTVGKLYGQILAEMGLLSKGEVVTKNPSDFIGAHLGQSETNTKSILTATVGKVLIIDEAYMLYGGKGDGGNQTDPYKTAVVDTIVAEVQSVPGDDRCVLLLGYKDDMMEMFQNVNPGLSRRFAIDAPFNFEDFTDAELSDILDKKLKEQDLRATDAAKKVAIEVLSRARNRPNFGNAGEVENILTFAKSHYQSRRASLPPKQRHSHDIVFEPQDFDPDFDRLTTASTNLQKLFEDVVGCDEIIQKLEGWQELASVMKSRGEDSRHLIPTNFVFKGPPGTGKTTIARKMGQVYFDMGFLSSKEVVECSASDLVGQYVGQTGPKTKKLFEKALGRVLFIDEAYRLSEGHFAQEAVDEMVGMLTQDKFKSKMVVILAGYDKDMNKLMAVNSGLSSRFPEEIVLHNFSPEKCLEILNKQLKKKNVYVDELDDPSCKQFETMMGVIQDLSELDSWGNARDMITLSEQMISSAIRASKGSPKDAKLVFTAQQVIAFMKSMLSSKRERASNLPQTSRSLHSRLPQASASAPPRSPPPALTSTMAQTTSAPPPQQKKLASEATPPPESNLQPPPPPDGRDLGVSDEVWRQLQEDKRAAEDAARRTAVELQNLARESQKARDRAEDRKREAKRLAEAEARAKDEAERAELKRRQEEARRLEIAAQRERDRIAAELKRRRRADEERQRKEAQVQQKLRNMGVCVAGFQWIPTGSGYRCAGGSHFVSNAQLGL